jgi:hypothetical protein
LAENNIGQKQFFDLPANTRNALVRNEEEIIFQEQVELSILMTKPANLIELWNNSVIQFGYIAFFSIAFPAAPLWGLLINIFHLNMSFFSFHTHVQRPVCLERGSIGIWNMIFFTYSLIALAINTGLLMFTSDGMLHLLDFDGSTIEHSYKIAIILGISENIVFMIKYVLSAIIPDRPKWVEKEQKNRKLRSGIDQDKFKVLQYNNKLTKKLDKKVEKATPSEEKPTLYHKIQSLKREKQSQLANSLKNGEYAEFDNTFEEDKNDFDPQLSR